MDIELSEGFVIETGVVGFTEDGVIIHLDEDAMEFLDFNGVLLESEENLNEDEGTADAVCDAILNRIARQHGDVLQKFGPKAVMYAAEDLAQDYNDLDEIGSSDVSIWTKQVIQDLESGQYAHLNEGPDGDVEQFKAKISTSDDPFDLVYDAISGKHGETIRAAMQDMYDDIVIDFGLHPDDDFEKVIDKMLDYLDADSVMKEDEQLDELSDIKRLSGQEEVDEGLGKAPSGDDQIDEAEYQGRKVPLGKPMQGDVAKSKVYVKKPNGKVVKVNFGDKNMTIKKNNPARRKSFRARHNCDNPGPRWKARYWSCRAW
jgi:hypothetical protein